VKERQKAAGLLHIGGIGAFGKGIDDSRKGSAGKLDDDVLAPSGTAYNNTQYAIVLPNTGTSHGAARGSLQRVENDGAARGAGQRARQAVTDRGGQRVAHPAP
jgi:hypothetical protein